MTTQQQVKKLMDTMAEHNCNLLQAQIRLTREFNDQMETATTLIRNTFERDGELTSSSKVVA